jgi:hypothetical protein
MVFSKSTTSLRLANDMGFSKKAIDYTGQTIAGWKIVCRDENHERLSTSAHWLCECCNCGSKKTVQQPYLKNGSPGSCICMRATADEKKTKRKIKDLENQIESKKSKLVALKAELKKTKP